MVQNYLNIFISELKQFKDFSSKTSRRNYWSFILVYTIFSAIVSAISKVTGLNILSIIFSLALFVPSLAIAVRRMHDVNKHPLFLLIPFYNLYLLVQKGE